MYQRKRKRGEKHGTYIGIVSSEDEGEEGHDEGEYDSQPHVLQTGLYTLLGHSLVIDYTEGCVKNIDIIYNQFIKNSDSIDKIADETL